MKLKYISLAAALFAGLFTACDDSGLDANNSIASYDTLPKFCEEGDTVKHAGTGILFYCKSGEWFEVGAVIPTAKSSSSTAEPPKSSEAKDGDTQSSDAGTEVENPDGTESSSSSCTGRRCKTEDSSDSNSSDSGNSTDSNSSTGNSANSGDSSDSNSSTSNSSTSTLDRDPLFMWMDSYVDWKKDTPTFDDGDRSATMGIVKTQYSDEQFVFTAKVTGFLDVDLSVLSKSNIDLVGEEIGLSTPALSDYRMLFVKKVFDSGKMTSYFVAGPTDPTTSVYRYVEIGIYEGNIEELIESLAATETICGDMWCGPAFDYRVITGMDAHEDGELLGTSGYWFSYNDENDGGESDITWPVGLGNDYSTNALDPFIKHCKGLCGTAVLDKGELFYDPFAGVAFAIAGVESYDEPHTPVAANVSAWGGICVVYTSDADINIKLGLSDEKESALGLNVPNYTISESSDQKVVNISWSDFTQNSWGNGESITGADAAKELVYLRFEIQRKEGSYDFNITSVGTYGSCKAVEKVVVEN